jgi:hypothetical protein
MKKTSATMNVESYGAPRMSMETKRVYLELHLTYRSGSRTKSRAGFTSKKRNELYHMKNSKKYK